MPDILLEPLPTVWKGRPIDPDFRPMIWLSNQYLRGRARTDPQGMAQEALRRFYRQPIPLLEAPAAWDALLEFYAAGACTGRSSRSGHTAQISFDYAADADYIAAAFQQAYGIDLTTAHIHWWRFRALFRSLPKETLMARIMTWRTMDTTGMDGRDRQRYEDLKEAFALPPELTNSRPALTVAEHDAAFLARFRRNDPEVR